MAQIGWIAIGVMSLVMGVLSIAFLILFFMYKSIILPIWNGALFKLILYLIFPLVLYCLTVGAATWSQYETANTTDTTLAFLGSINMLKYIYIALAVSYFTYFRAPVVAFIPYNPKIKGIDDVLTIESDSPWIEGAGISYYIFFGVLLGIISSIGSSAIASV